MKKFLIAGNLLLAALTLLLFFANITRKPAPVRKNTAAKKKTAAKKTAEPKVSPLPGAEQAQAIFIKADIFNQQRSPFANTRGGRLELKLLGTFKVGKVIGAIILQRGQQRQVNPYLQQVFGMMGGPGGPPGMMGGPGMQQNGRNNSRRNSRESGNSRRNGGMQNMGMRGNMRERFSRGGVFGMEPGNQNSAGADLGTKQYVRLGEQLSNGYTLTEVTRTRAVLTRGGDKLELELQDPSKNLSASRSGKSSQKLNPAQQLQQAQMLQQAMMMRMMSRMQNGGGGMPQGGNMRGGGMPQGGNMRGGGGGGRR